MDAETKQLMHVTHDQESIIEIYMNFMDQIITEVRFLKGNQVKTLEYSPEEFLRIWPGTHAAVKIRQATEQKAGWYQRRKSA